MDLTLLTCNYNTSDQVINLLRSLGTVASELPNVVVMNNSTVVDDYIPFHVYDVPYYNFHGASHGEGVNLGFQKVKTRYVLLCDSDVIFLQDLQKPFERFKQSGCALMGKVVGDVAGKSLYPRVEPWYCFIDLEQLKRHKIKFFDRERSKRSKSESRVYDIGSTMFEDVTKAGLTVGDVDLEGKYFKHYGGMSWHCAKYDPGLPDTDVDFGGSHPNRGIYEHGERVREQYEADTASLDGVNIKGAFSNE